MAEERFQFVRIGETWQFLAEHVEFHVGEFESAEGRVAVEFHAEFAVRAQVVVDDDAAEHGMIALQYSFRGEARMSFLEFRPDAGSVREAAQRLAVLRQKRGLATVCWTGS